MARTELELNPVDFITIGTIGPKGKRVFHLQSGYEGKLITFTIEKEQARVLSETIQEFIEELDIRLNTTTNLQMAGMDMDLREPLRPLFRVAQMGLSFEDLTQRVILEVRELPTGDDMDLEDAGVVRMWCSREQMYALSIQAMDMVEAGRPSPRQNGNITYYWM